MSSPFDGGFRSPMVKRDVTSASLWFPTREEVLTYIRDNPEKASKRDIARAFNIKGQDRIALKKVLKGLADDGLISGHKKRFSEAGELPPVLVVDIHERDGDGDLIARPAKWEEDDAPPPRILIDHGKKSKGRAPGIGDRVLARIVDRDINDSERPAYTANVIKILDKTPASVLGIVRFGAHAEALPRLLPVDRRQREMEIVELNGAEDGDLVEVKLTKIGKYGDARAHVLNRIGSLKSEKAISHIAIHEHEIPHVFPDPVLAEAERARETSVDAKREDWRDVPLITIDPADAKDHDDAVFAVADDDENNPGGHIVTIAIADVSYYVRPAASLDIEAVKRGNSVYFPDRVVPMLPERISNNLCSLKEGLDRPAIAVKVWLDRDGKKRKHRFHRVMMRSHAGLAYEEAQDAMDGNPTERAATVLKTTLKPLWAAYASLKRERKDREPLDLNVTERKIRLDDEGRVADVVVPKRLTAHKLIEEFMILANVAAAEALEARKTPVIYRVHDAPSLAKLEALRDFLSTIDLKLPKAGNIRPSHFNRILEGVKGANHELLTNQVILRSQAQAEYAPENYGHFGLNLQRYAHFTSPIRRYADLMVHRALVSAYDLGEGGLGDVDIDALRDLSTAISATERRAMAAERATVDRLIAEWLSDKVGALFWGRIGGVTKSGLFITLDDSGADGFIPISTLADDYFHYDDARHSLVGERGGMTYTMGDRVQVKLVEALPFAGALRFEMMSEGTKGRAGARAFPKARSGRRGGPPKGVSRKIRRKRP
ncbi:MAG: ribonuclease R [Pseudomonadota bacterium]